MTAPYDQPRYWESYIHYSLQGSEERFPPPSTKTTPSITKFCFALHLHFREAGVTFFPNQASIFYLSHQRKRPLFPRLFMIRRERRRFFNNIPELNSTNALSAGGVL